MSIQDYKEWLKKVRLTVCIETDWMKSGHKDLPPKYVCDCVDEYGVVHYHVYADDKRVIERYISVSKYNLHKVSSIHKTQRA